MGQAFTFATSPEARHTSEPRPSPTVSLLDAEPAFAAAVPPADHALARRVIALPLWRVPPGRWETPPRSSWRLPVAGLLVVSGAITCDAHLAGRTATDFAGAGDVLHPWTEDDDVLGCERSYAVHQPATLAVLDGRFALAAAKWPGLSLVLADRLAEQTARARVHTAISHLPRVEQRVLAMLWRLADRFGRVSPDGVVVGLPLTHSLIGQCVGARRPTVSLALRSLLEDGLLSRASDGGWLLSNASLDALR